jgi:hypothetical protein
MSASPVANDGVHGPMVARYPFSWVLRRVMEATRKPIEAANANRALTLPELRRRLQGSSEAIFGEAICALWSHVPRQPVDACSGSSDGGEEAMPAYLHDVVAMAAPRFSGLSFRDVCVVYRGVVRASGQAPPPAVVFQELYSYVVTIDRGGRGLPRCSS